MSSYFCGVHDRDLHWVRLHPPLHFPCSHIAKVMWIHGLIVAKGIISREPESGHHANMQIVDVDEEQKGRGKPGSTFTKSEHSLVRITDWFFVAEEALRSPDDLTWDSVVAQLAERKAVADLVESLREVCN